jgi:hypothetical protein
MGTGAVVTAVGFVVAVVPVVGVVAVVVELLGIAVVGVSDVVPEPGVVDVTVGSAPAGPAAATERAITAMVLTRTAARRDLLSGPALGVAWVVIFMILVPPVGGLGGDDQVRTG